MAPNTPFDRDTDELYLLTLGVADASPNLANTLARDCLTWAVLRHPIIAAKELGQRRVDAIKAEMLARTKAVGGNGRGDIMAIVTLLEDLEGAMTPTEFTNLTGQCRQFLQDAKQRFDQGVATASRQAVAGVALKKELRAKESAEHLGDAISAMFERDRTTWM